MCNAGLDLLQSSESSEVSQPRFQERWFMFVCSLFWVE